MSCDWLGLHWQLYEAFGNSAHWRAEARNCIACLGWVGPVPKSHYLRGGFMTKLCPNMIFCVSLRSICSSGVPSCTKYDGTCIYPNLQTATSHIPPCCLRCSPFPKLFIPKPHKQIPSVTSVVHGPVHGVVWMARHSPWLITPNRQSPDNQFRKLNKPIYHFHLSCKWTVT